MGGAVDATEVVLGDRVLVITVLAAEAVTQTVLNTVLVCGVTEEVEVIEVVDVGVEEVTEGEAESVATGSSTAGAAGVIEGSANIRDGVG